MQTKIINVTKPRALKFSETPADLELTTARVFLSPLIAIKTESVSGENSALAKALLGFKNKSDEDDVSDLTDFIQKFPNSRWRASLECILGQIRLETGYFNDALKYWTSSWELSKGETELRSKSVADEAISRLIGLYGRLGEQDVLAKYLRDIEDRKFSGSSDTRVQGAKTQLAQMRLRPEICFKCGPAALHVLAQTDADLKTRAQSVIGNAHSTHRGTNLAQLSNWAKEIGFDYVAARRTELAPLIVPCVVHWKVGHFAAVVAQEGNLFTVKDLTFGSAGVFKISAQAINSESDNYFLIPKGELKKGWELVSDAEAKNVWGKGISPERDAGAKTPPLPKSPPPHNCNGMAVASAFSMQASLNIIDIPLSYQPPIGAAIQFLANYNYLEAGQPAPGAYTFSNLGPNWSLNWISYVQSATSPSTNPTATVFVRGGGSEIYEAASTYSHDVYSQALLIAGSDYYQRDLPDGSQEIFSSYDGTKNYFLTSVVDPQGNVTTISYDDTFRVTSVTDCFGQSSTFDYGSNTEGEIAYYAITQISDPFGRMAVFQYDSTFTNLLLITDQIGMQSTFVYSQEVTSFISTMVTPYGQTSFEIYEPSTIAVGLKTTWPDGSITKVESWIGIEMKTYYWDRWTLTLYPDDPANQDYSHCVTTHWVGEPITEVMSAVPFWVQPPLEYTIWYMYNDCYWNGYAPAPDHFWLGDQTINNPIQILRTVPNSMPPSLESLQTWTYSYGTDPKSNSFGYAIQTQDPLATPRIFDFNYASNNIDLVSTKQDTTGELISQTTFNSQHRPLTQTDGSGNVLSISYNAQGQPLTSTDANSSLTTFTYSAQAAILAGSVVSGDTKTLSVTISNASLPGGTITKSYTVGSSDTLSSIAMALASAINSDTNLQAASITATWVAGEPINHTPALYFNSFSKDATSYSVSTSGSGAETITLATSSCGYLMQIEGPLGPSNKTNLKYDSVGRVRTITNSEGYTLTKSYDDMDRLTELTYPDGTTDLNVWDKLDIVATYDRMGNAHQYTFNSLDQLASEIDALGQQTQYSYCRCGALTQLIDGNGNKTNWQYDLQGRLIKKTYQDLTTVQYSYDQFGRLATRTDALQQVTTYGYNADNTLATVTYTNAVNETPTVEYGYDQNFQRIVQVTNYIDEPSTPIASYSYSYNPYVSSSGNKAYIFIGGLPQTPDATDTIDITFRNSVLSGGEYALPTYSVLSGDVGEPSLVASHLASTINADSTLTAAGITAGANGTLVTITASTAISVSPSASGSTSALIGGGGQLASTTNSAIENSTVSYGYDSLGRTVLRMINGANNLISWGFDSISRVTAETNNLGTFDYSYVDNATGQSKGDPRLASVTYPNGQVTNFSYYPNLLDQRLQQISNLKSDGSTLSQFDYRYDPVGRITQWPQLQNNTSRVYSLDYDRIGQLTGARIKNGQGEVSRSYLGQTYYGYDPGANRTAVQTVTIVNARIGGTITAADTVELTVSDSALPDGAVSVNYTVQSGNSFSDIAAALALAVNTNSDLQDLGVTAIPSGSLIALRSVSANITSYAATLNSGASETITFGATENFVVNATVSGSKTTGDTISLSAFDEALSGGSKTVTYTVLSTDTLNTIASGLKSAINSDTDLSTLGVNASASDSVVTIRSTSENATTYSQSTSAGATEIVDISLNPNHPQLIAIGGSKTTGDNLKLYFYDDALTGGVVNVSYTVLSTDTLSTIATAFASAISADNDLQGIGVSASSSANILTVRSDSNNLTTYRQVVGNGATEQIILDVPVNGVQTAVISGSATVGDILNISVYDDGLATNPVVISHTVVSGETLPDVAAAFASAINGSSELAAINVSASADSTVVYITSKSIRLTTYAQTLSDSATEDLILGASYGISQYICNKVNALTAILPGGEARIEGMTNKPVVAVAIDGNAIGLNYSQQNYPSYSVSTNANSMLTLGTLVNGNDTVTVGGATLTVTTVAPALVDGQVSVNYTVQTTDTFASVATALAEAVNANTDLTGIGVSATSSSSIVDLSVDAPTYSVSTSSGATETITLGTIVEGRATINIGGSVTAGDVVIITTHNVALTGGAHSVPYTVQTGDSLLNIANNLAQLLNESTELQKIGVSSTSSTIALLWSEKFVGKTILAEGPNSITITATDATSTSASSNIQVLVKGPAATSLTYDLNGNMTCDGTNTYQWDAENRLIQINYPGGGNSSQFSYDGGGNCIQLSEMLGDEVTETRKFIWADGGLCEALIENYSRFLNRNDTSPDKTFYFPMGQISAEGRMQFTFDQLTSVREVTDDSELVQAQADYDLYGQLKSTTGTQFPDFSFSGYYYHRNSGLLLSQHGSAYDANRGQWLSDGKGSSYGVQGNNPVISGASKRDKDPGTRPPDIFKMLSGVKNWATADKNERGAGFNNGDWHGLPYDKWWGNNISALRGDTVTAMSHLKATGMTGHGFRQEPGKNDFVTSVNSKIDIWAINNAGYVFWFPYRNRHLYVIDPNESGRPARMINPRDPQAQPLPPGVQGYPEPAGLPMPDPDPKPNPHVPGPTSCPWNPNGLPTVHNTGTPIAFGSGTVGFGGGAGD